MCSTYGCDERVDGVRTANLALPDGLEALMLANKRAVEEPLFRQYEDRLLRLRGELQRELDSGNRQQADLLRHRNHIIEDILTIRCPYHNCKLPFLMDPDFDECFALKCEGCGHGFCGWCLVNCGTDAHSHVPTCRPQDTQPRVLFPQYDNRGRLSAKDCFDLVHGPRRGSCGAKLPGFSGPRC